MTQDIDQHLSDLTTAIVSKDDEAAGVAAIRLIASFFKDVRRIADAVTLVANVQVHVNNAVAVDEATYAANKAREASDLASERAADKMCPL